MTRSPMYSNLSNKLSFSTLFRTLLLFHKPTLLDPLKKGHGINTVLLSHSVLYNLLSIAYLFAFKKSVLY